MNYLSILLFVLFCFVLFVSYAFVYCNLFFVFLFCTVSVMGRLVLTNTLINNN
jgi:hypothetical protein